MRRDLRSTGVTGAVGAAGAFLAVGLGSLALAPGAFADFFDIFGDVIDSAGDVDPGGVADFLDATDAASALADLPDVTHGLDELTAGSLSALLNQQLSELGEMTVNPAPAADAGPDTWLYGTELPPVAPAEAVAAESLAGVGSTGGDLVLPADAVPAGLDAVGQVGIGDTGVDAATTADVGTDADADSLTPAPDTDDAQLAVPAETAEAPADVVDAPATGGTGLADVAPATGTGAGTVGGAVPAPAPLPVDGSSAASATAGAQAEVAGQGADGGLGFRESAGDNMTLDGGDGGDGGAAGLR